MKIKPTIDREATKEELERIKKTEKMLAEEQKLPPISQMVRNLAVDHWKSRKCNHLSNCSRKKMECVFKMSTFTF